MRKLFWKIKKRLFCYFCMEEKKLRLAKKYGRFPIDADYSVEDETIYPVYSNVGMCKEHLYEYENGEGKINPYEYL